jgi:hypothetical protein
MLSTSRMSNAQPSTQHGCGRDSSLSGAVQKHIKTVFCTVAPACRSCCLQLPPNAEWLESPCGFVLNCYCAFQLPLGGSNICLEESAMGQHAQVDCLKPFHDLATMTKRTANVFLIVPRLCTKVLRDQDAPRTLATDVYAFGIVLYEIMQVSCVGALSV